MKASTTTAKREGLHVQLYIYAEVQSLNLQLIENKLISKGSFGIERYFPLHTVSTESPKTKISAAESGGNGC